MKKYISEIKKYSALISESLKKGDFTMAKSLNSLMGDTIKEYEHAQNVVNEAATKNFGVLNYIINENIPELFKNNKKAVKDIIKTIKEDKNLSTQFAFYNFLNEYDTQTSEIVSPEKYVDTAINMLEGKINKGDITKSNAKLAKVMAKHHIVPSKLIEESDKSYFESCQNLITKNNNFNNAKTIIESKKVVETYINSNKKTATKKSNSTDIYKMMEAYAEKKKATLNEDEQDFVNQITSSKSKKKEELFNSLKNECLEKINSMLKESENDEKSGLTALKTRIEEKVFSENTIVSDIAKLLEIRDVLDE